ncbi:hypothetical protein FACS189413_04950 [Bacteroidia bacterium]|nr:hypothetical protein FACS189413_04950 [Bacteroidia bacterium]
MKNRLFITAIAFLLFGAGLSAQKITSLEVTHKVAGEDVLDRFSFEGGTLTILNGDITAGYANEALNKVYAFGDVLSLSLITAIPNAIVALETDENVPPFVDNRGILHIHSAGSPVEIFSITGAKIARFTATENQAQYDLSACPNSIFLVKTGNKTVKVIKH